MLPVRGSSALMDVPVVSFRANDVNQSEAVERCESPRFGGLRGFYRTGVPQRSDGEEGRGEVVNKPEGIPGDRSDTRPEKGGRFWAFRRYGKGSTAVHHHRQRKQVGPRCRTAQPSPSAQHRHECTASIQRADGLALACS